MNTAQFIRYYADNYNVSYIDAEAWVRTIFECLHDLILEEEEVKITKIGNFRHIYKDGGKRWDMKNGGYRSYPPSMGLGFVPSEQLKKEIKKLEPKIDKWYDQRMHRDNLPHKTYTPEEEAAIAEADYIEDVTEDYDGTGNEV